MVKVKRVRITLTTKQYEQIMETVNSGVLGTNPADVIQKIVLLYLTNKFK